MKTLGQKIKEKRLEMGLKQAELAEGICTQSIISSLENDTSTLDLLVLIAVGSRLDLDIDDLPNYVSQKKNQNAPIFEQMRILRSQFKDAEARDLLLEKINVDQLTTAFELKSYYYYLGITNLIGYNRFSDAYYNFDLALKVDTGHMLDSLDILATNSIGLTYFMQNESDKALTYFEKSLSQLDNFINYSFSSKENIEIIKIYYTTAKFYAGIGEYEKSLNLCNLGIMLQMSHQVNYDLERLYYEKAFNLSRLGRLVESGECYEVAASLARMDENEFVFDVIREEMKNFNLGTNPF